MTVRQVAISYCSSEFLGMHGELVTDCAVFNLEHTTRPLLSLAAPDHVTVTDYNDKVLLCIDKTVGVRCKCRVGVGFVTLYINYINCHKKTSDLCCISI